MSSIRKYTTSGRRKSKQEIRDSYFSKYKYKCKCSHVMMMPYNVEKILCDHCGNYIYKTRRAEFKDKLSKELRKKDD